MPLKKTLFFTCLVFHGAFLQAQVLFQNISTTAGLDYQGRTYGSSWGDINGDGLPDLYLSCHQLQAEPLYQNDSIRIYLNMGAGQFNDGIYQLDDGGQSDFHGGVFYDADNDGDQDMLLVTGGTKQNVFLRNEGTTALQDHAEEMNIALDKSRGRQSTLLDLDNDGVTDVLVNNDEPKNPLGHGSLWMMDDPDQGYVTGTGTGFNTPWSWVSCISDLDGDHRSDLVVVNIDSLNIYGRDETGLLTPEVRLDYSNITDISVADFNGDLLPDIFVARGLTQESDIQQFDSTTILGTCQLLADEAPCAVDFKANGPIQLTVISSDGDPYAVHIGNDSSVPGAPFGSAVQLTLDPAQDSTHGFLNPLVFSDSVHFSVGYVLPDSVWRIKVAEAGSGASVLVFQVTSMDSITDVVTSGIPVPGEESRNVLLLNQGNFQFTESTDPAFALDEYSISVTAGDFDNDMDNDIMVMETGRAKNRPDHLYENLGDGTFAVHANGWGTQGDVAGIGDAVTAADMDNDGFLDLFVTNGSTEFFLDSAGVDLYQNLGNGNHWITLDLQGTVSNADGFGAVAYAQAGGITQVANRTGGIHAACQDDARLHFGLGANTAVETLTVHWPSGLVDVLHDLAADQILTIVEGEHPDDTGLQAHLPTPCPQVVPDADHVIVRDALGRTVGSFKVEERPMPASDLHLTRGMYTLSFADLHGKILEVRKYMQP